MTEFEALRIAEYNAPGDVERVEGRYWLQKRCYEGPSDCSAVVRGDAEALHSQARLERGASLAAVQAAIERFGRGRGRKTVLLLTEGFPHDAGEEPSRRVVRAAERVNAAVYFVDVRGVVALAAVGLRRRAERRGAQLLAHDPRAGAADQGPDGAGRPGPVEDRAVHRRRDDGRGHRGPDAARHERPGSRARAHLGRVAKLLSPGLSPDERGARRPVPEDRGEGRPPGADRAGAQGLRDGRARAGQGVARTGRVGGRAPAPGRLHPRAGRRREDARAGRGRGRLRGPDRRGAQRPAGRATWSCASRRALGTAGRAGSRACPWRAIRARRRPAAQASGRRCASSSSCRPAGTRCGRPLARTRPAGWGS